MLNKGTTGDSIQHVYTIGLALYMARAYKQSPAKAIRATAKRLRNRVLDKPMLVFLRATIRNKVDVAVTATVQDMIAQIIDGDRNGH